MALSRLIFLFSRWRESAALRWSTQSQTSSTAPWRRRQIASLKSALAGRAAGGTCPRDYLMAEPRVPAKARQRGCARGCPQGFPRRGCPPLSARRLSDSLSVGLTASLSAGQHKSSASQLDRAARQSSSTTQLDHAACPARLCPRQAWPRANVREPGSACHAERAQWLRARPTGCTACLSPTRAGRGRSAFAPSLASVPPLLSGSA